MSKLGKINLDGISLETLSDMVDMSKFADAAKNVNIAKLTSLLKKEEEEEIVEEKKTRVWLVILAILGIIVIGCVVGYLVYRHFKPDYLEDFEDEFEDDDPFEDDDDFFVDSDEN